MSFSGKTSTQPVPHSPNGDASKQDPIKPTPNPAFEKFKGNVVKSAKKHGKELAKDALVTGAIIAVTRKTPLGLTYLALKSGNRWIVGELTEPIIEYGKDYVSEYISETVKPKAEAMVDDAIEYATDYVVDEVVLPILQPVTEKLDEAAGWAQDKQDSVTHIIEEFPMPSEFITDWEGSKDKTMSLLGMGKSEEEPIDEKADWIEQYLVDNFGYDPFNDSFPDWAFRTDTTGDGILDSNLDPRTAAELAWEQQMNNDLLTPITPEFASRTDKSDVSPDILVVPDKEDLEEDRTSSAPRSQSSDFDDSVLKPKHGKKKTKKRKRNGKRRTRI
jgi:hypothetical protein